jgi:hypothetical protein
MESYQDHSDYLYNSPRYESLFKLSPTDYKSWAYGLKKAGYATNPQYPQILISNIEKYNLQQYNEPASGERMADQSSIQVTEPLMEASNATSLQNTPSHVGASVVVEKEPNAFRKLFSNKKNTPIATTTVIRLGDSIRAIQDSDHIFKDKLKTTEEEFILSVVTLISFISINGSL